MASNKLTCKELVELVTDYLDEALPPPERARFETHLKGCANCTAYFAQMRQTIRMTGKLTEEALSPMAKDELLQIFRDWKNTPSH